MNIFWYYANGGPDDITIIATRPEDIDIIQGTLHEYEEAIGAQINTHKSRAFALGSWDKSTPIMDIQYHDEIKIIGFNMTNNAKESANKSWVVLTGKSVHKRKMHTTEH